MKNPVNSQHTLPALTSEATLCGNLKREFGALPALTSEATYAVTSNVSLGSTECP